MSAGDIQARERVKGWLYIGEGAAVSLGAIAWLWFVFFEPIGAIDYVIFATLAGLAAFLFWLGRRALGRARRLGED